MKTPSTEVPTPGSKLSAKSSWPMPRMNQDNIDGELKICDVDDSCTSGVRFASCETLSTPFSCRAAPEKAAKAIGTRSEERRLRKACVRTCRSQWWQNH